ncbi:Tetratricopeptide repeat-containing protein [Persephonella hydrogeniphila]|uniref:Tetratricopeptide repeat-containing protein n=1 Tax=Persephonella hydrogeniphila TaxID=198703 RepID=A0A285NA43_9AQUI|nr:tetratricopeptide repeat protein [Persephonella hydrogeniphila]SNZ06345.1 Tetratricopeptide repeat-containing protein [Persephonella hydrogeniphila]
MRRFFVLIFMLIFTGAYTQEIKVPEVTFPIEIIAIKQEKKPFLSPPDRIELKEKVKIKLFVEEVKPIPPYDVKPPVIHFEKPSSFLGIPEENALMSGAIDDFLNKRYLYAKEKLEKLIRKYPNVSFIADAYYLLGLVYSSLGESKKAVDTFTKGCNLPVTGQSKDYSCISAAVINLKFQNIDKAEETLKKAENTDENYLFWHGVIFAHLLKPQQAYELIKDIKCENLDINFINYCKYMKGYILFAKSEFEKALPVLNSIDTPAYYKHTLLLKGFSYLNTGRYPEAKAYFQKFLEGYSSVEKISDYAIYGLGIIDIHYDRIKDALEKAGILESRNKELAQNLYIKIAENLTDKGDFKTAFVILQRSAKTGNKYIDYLRKKIAVTAYNTGNYRYAFLMFKDIDTPLFNLYAGYALLKMKKTVEAKDYFEKALKLAETESIKEQALKYLSDIYFQLRDFKDYLQTVKKLKIYDPDYAADLLGWYFFYKKEYKKAFMAFKDPYMKAVSAFNGDTLTEAYSIVKDRKDRKSRFLLAYIYLKKGDLDKARKVLKELALTDDKIGKEAGYLYAYSYFSEGNYRKAAQEFWKYAKKYRETPLGRKAILRMADSYYNLGDIERARQIYKAFIQKYANSPEAIDAAYQLTILEMKGSEGNVAQQIESFIKKYPNYPFVNLLKVQLGDYYLEHKEFDKAEKIYTEIVQSDVKESDYAFYKLGYLYYEKGQLEKAVQILEKYTENFPKGEFLVPVKTLLVKIYQETGDLDKAISVLKTLPDTDENRYKLAVLYYKKGDLVQAKNYFEDIYTRFPKYRNDIAYYLGKIQLEQGYTDMALKYFEEAIGGSDYYHVAESYFLMGVIYQKNGETENALNNFINVIYLYPEAKEFVIKARLKAAEIMKESGQKKEASCMLKPLLKEELEKNLKEKLQELIKGLPECR